MSDLINKEKFIYTLIFSEKTKSIFVKDLRSVIEVANEMPSAEPERKRGKWIDEKINSYTSRTYCSECGSSAPFVYESDDYYGNHAHGETVKTKFCPNCGAEMTRGE